MDTIMNYRYPGSRPFEDTPFDRRLFFGREHEKQVFFHTVLAEKMLVLYAKSGIGKTSFLNAGLMQLLREKDFLPIVVRFNDITRDPLQAIFESIKLTAHQNAIQYDEKKSLWQHFSTFEFKTFDVWASKDVPLTPVVILDQFEDFFKLHAPEKRKSFTTQFADLIRDRDFLYSRAPFPQTETSRSLKIIISLREEYLGQLEEMSDEIPGILQNRFRLVALTRKQARQAIEEPAKLQDKHLRTKSFSYAPETIEAMLDFLCQQRRRDDFRMTNEIEPFQLQLLCQDIENTVCNKLEQEDRSVVVQKHELGGEPGMQRVLQNFYNDQVNRLNSLWKRRRVQKLCEKGLISVTNQRLSLEEGQIERRFKVSKNLLVELVNNRLLRDEPRVGSVYYELSHDTLVKPIRKSQKDRKDRNDKVGGIITLIITIFFIISLAIIEFTPRGQIWQVKRELSELSQELLDDNTLSKVAIAFAKAGDLEQARNIAKIIYDPDVKSAALRALAETAVKLGDVDKARELLNQSLGVIDSEGFEAKAAALRALAEAAVKLGDVDTAKELLNQALEEVATIGYPDVKSAVLQALAEAFRKLGDVDTARELLNQALEEVATIDIEGFEAKAAALWVLAEAFGKLGDVDTARELLNESLEVAEIIEFPDVKAAALRALAEAAVKLGDVDKARELLNQSLEVAEIIEFPDVKAAALQALAEAFRRLGDVNKAEVAATIEFPENKAAALRALAEAFGKLSDVDTARELLNESLDVAEIIEFPDVKATALRALAEAFGKLGDVDTARELLNQSLDVAATIESLDAKAVTLQALAEAFGKLGDVDTARELLNQSLDVAEIIEFPDVKAPALRALAEAFGKLGDVGTARELLNQSLDVAATIEFPDVKATALRALAEAFWKLGDVDTARELLNQSLEVVATIEFPDAAVALRLIAESAVKLGNITGIEKLLARTLEVTVTIKGDIRKEENSTEDSFDKDQALLFITLAYANIGNWRKAHQVVVDRIDSNDDKIEAIAAILSAWTEKRSSTVHK